MTESSTAKTSLAIGVTGSIGSGKSEACKIFQKLGGEIRSSDDLAKSLMENDPKVRRSVSTLFETPVYKEDGTLDRKALAKMMFSDDSAKARIESIVHPAVIDSLITEIEERKEKGVKKLLFVESALIFEVEIDELFDYTIVVNSDPATASKRVVGRDHATEQEVESRRRTQLTDEKKSELADFTIVNNGDLQELETKCRFIYQLLTTLSV